MQLNLFVKFFWQLALLISTALADCYADGSPWSAIGDENAITTAFNGLCSKMAGDYKTGNTVKHCINVANNRVDASIVIFETENSSFTDDATLYADVCEKLLVQVKNGCPDKGGFMNASAHTGSEFHQYGYIYGEIRADPNKCKC